MTENKFTRKKSQLTLLATAGLLIAILGLYSTLNTDISANNEIGQEFTPEDADIHVAIGEYYFQQEDSDLPADVLEAEVGDVIRFHNEGDMPHTATVEELGLNEYLNPGEEAYLKVDESVEDTRVDCLLHANHDATLTVTE